MTSITQKFEMLHLIFLFNLVLKLAQSKNCKLGVPLENDQVIQTSSAALSFLKKCDYQFVNKYVDNNFQNGDKMNPILDLLNLHSPQDWEQFTETKSHSSLKDEEAKEDLEACVSKCTRKDRRADFIGKAYEELLEKFIQGKITKKPDYSCPKCVKYLPAKTLAKIPDSNWGLKQKSRTITTTKTTTREQTTKIKTTTQPLPTSSATTEEITTAETSTVGITTNKTFIPPIPTRRVKCGYEHVELLGGQFLLDPSNKNRFTPSGRCNMSRGNKTYQGQIPWHVSLRDRTKGETFCSGTLINSWTVLTAAHCLHEGKGGTYLRKRFLVGLGWHKSNGTNNDILEEDRKFGKQIIKIDLRKGEGIPDYGSRVRGEVIVHPEYLGKDFENKTSALRNDIAIIILPREVWFPDNSDSMLPGSLTKLGADTQQGTLVRPICMPHLDKTDRIGIQPLHPFTQQQLSLPGSEFLAITGFVFGTRLTKGYQSTMKNNECQKRINQKTGKKVLLHKQICSDDAHIYRQTMISEADYGGPAYKIVDMLDEKARKMNWTEEEKRNAKMDRVMQRRYESPRAQLIGILGSSFGQNTPGIHTRVSEYLDWIRMYVHEWYTVDGQTI